MALSSSMLLFQEKRSSQDGFVVVDVGEHTAKLGLCRGKGTEALLENLRTYEYQKIRAEERIQEVVDFAASFGVRDSVWTFTSSVLKTRVVTYVVKRQNAPFVIQNQEKEELKDKALKEAEEKGKETLASETGILGDEFVCVKHFILAMRIDGYDVQELKGFSGEMIEFRIALIFLQEKIRSSLAKSILSSTMKVRGIGGEAFSLEQFCKNTSVGDALFVDVGDMGTRFFMFSRGIIVLSGEFKKGGDRYTRIIEQSLGMNRQSAQDLKHRYGSRSLEEEVRRKLRELFVPECARWRQELTLILATEGKSVPRRVFFFGGGSTILEFQDAYEEGSLLLPTNMIPRSSSSLQFTSLALCAYQFISHE